MKITLLVVGKSKEHYIQQALNDYDKRINRYVPFSITEVPPVKVSRKLSTREVQQKEAKAIRKALPGQACIVLLDEQGKPMPSEGFARWMQKQMSSSIQHLVFVIGGAYGFPQDLFQEATEVFSLSRMTMSHQVVRVMFAEQLYRAFTILNGEPYHHGG